MLDSIVLLSGGMDSAYAAVWAMKNAPPKAFITFKYGQRGYQYEIEASRAIYKYCQRAFKRDDLTWYTIRVALPSAGNALQDTAMTLDPQGKDHHNNPLTFVPHRNLLFLTLAANLAYQMDCRSLVGGWSEVDVDYPDCSGDFLVQAQAALNRSVGTNMGYYRIRAPLLRVSKTDTVSKGNALGIPWRLTRSCYGDQRAACGVCDSCLIRARAFHANDLQDPAYAPDRWSRLVETLEKETSDDK